jgi:ParB family transcriptional regulator, chromosome partitioning protein
MNKEPDRSQRKALGKGLSALLPSRSNSAPALPQLVVNADPVPSEEFQKIPLDRIQADMGQPRDHFNDEKLAELSASIRAHGVIQPITVRPAGDGSYRIIAGERRWRAAALAGLKEIPALVRNIEEGEQLELALIENIQREDLNPIEIATAFHRLATERQLNHEQIAERTGKDRSTITNFLRLLKLSPSARHALINGEITIGHARALLNLDIDQQASLCSAIKLNQLSVLETESRVKRLTESAPPTPPEPKQSPEPLDPNVRAAIEEMSMALGTRVRVLPRKIEIEYYSQEDLDRIYSVIVK